MMRPRNPDENLTAAIDAVRDRMGPDPFDLAIILGSGLGQVAADVDPATKWAYNSFSCFPPGAVAGHAGQLVAGILHGRRTLIFQGRFHMYQGLTAWQTAMPVRLAHSLGCTRMLLTNAVGGIHADLLPGRFMFVCDHLNLLGDNPLRGLDGDTFIDLTKLYRNDLFPSLKAESLSQGNSLHQGVLAAVPGPSYETPAEVRALQLLGADAVSMSLVPEAIMARYLQMEVVGLSFTTNRAAGLGTQGLSHEEVLATGILGAADLSFLVKQLCRLWFS
ncbi:MAG: purine-nucleoside phosphorylase [Pedobacter sp.]